MKRLLKKARIFREQAKDRHTSHWDLDMLSREELEALMTDQAGRTVDGAQQPDKKTRARSK